MQPERPASSDARVSAMMAAMSKDTANTPDANTPDGRKIKDREARLARALRDNLKKRKDQARTRAARAEGPQDARLRAGPA